MTSELSTLVPPGFRLAIASAAEAASLPKIKTDRDHQAAMNGIGFHRGADGIAAYRQANPGTSHLGVNLRAVTYVKKPTGYDEYLVQLVERWVVSNTALAATNAADVERLGERFGRSFPPGKHFSEPLSKGRSSKIAAALKRHGIHIDTKRVDTMSKVRAAVRAARANEKPDRALGKAGVVSGDVLAMGGRTFRVEQNGDRDCIRVMIAGARRRIYLDDLEWMADLLKGGQDEPAPLTTTCSIGDLAYPPDPLENTAEQPNQILVLDCTVELNGLGKRIAALRASQESMIVAIPEGVDPLELEVYDLHSTA